MIFHLFDVIFHLNKNAKIPYVARIFGVLFETNF